MTKRWESTDTPEKEWYQNASFEAKVLYYWSKFNNHCNQAGVYTVMPKVIELYINLPRDKLVETFAELPDVEWFPEYNIIWIKDFLYEQNKGIKWLTSAGKALAECEEPIIIQEVLDYNKDKHNTIIPMPEENNGESEPAIELPELSNETNVIMKKWEDTIGTTLSQFDLENLVKLSDEHELPRIITAIEETKRRNGRSVNYLIKVLEGDSEPKPADAIQSTAGVEETF